MTFVPESRRSLAMRAVAAGALIALSLPPWGWWPLAVVGLAWWTRLEHRAEGRRFLIGFGAGLGWFLPGLAWMWFLTAPGYLIAALLFALAHGLASAVAVRRDDPWTAVLAPAAHTLIEVVRLAFPFGGVPLATLGIAQVAGPLHRTAAIGGVVLLTWLTWQIGELLSPVARRALRAEGRARVVVGAVIVVWLAGFVAPRGSDTNASLRFKEADRREPARSTPTRAKSSNDTSRRPDPSSTRAPHPISWCGPRT